MSLLIPFCTRDSGDGRRSTSLCYWESLWDVVESLWNSVDLLWCISNWGFFFSACPTQVSNGVLHDLQSQKADLVNAWVEASDNSVSLQLLWRQTSDFPWAQLSYLTIRFNPSVRCSKSFCKSEQPSYYFSISWFTLQQHFLTEFISPTSNKSVFTLPLGDDMGLESYALGN